MANGLLNMPEVGSPEYFAMLDNIPKQMEERTASNKAQYAQMVAAAGFNPETYDYANLQPEVLNKILSTPGADPKRALELSTMDYGNNSRLQDFDAYGNAAGKASAGGLTDAQMWSDYDQSAYKPSEFHKLMQGGVKAGLATMFAMGGADMMGYGNLAGGSQAGAVNPSAFGGPGSFAPNAVAAGDLSLLSMPGVPASVGGGAALGGAGAVASGIKGVGGSGGLLDLLGGSKTLGQIGGALAGAALAGQDSTTSSQKDPWGPAQQYLKDNLARNAELQSKYQQTPFNATQQTGYQNMANDLDQFRSQTAPGLLGFANQQTTANYQRQRPSAVGMGGYDAPAGTGPQVSPFQAPTPGAYGLIDWSKFKG